MSCGVIPPVSWVEKLLSLHFWLDKSSRAAPRRHSGGCTRKI